MARNGSGTYALPTGNPVVTNTTISSSWANTTLSDIATALTGSLAADGQTPVTANLPMGGFKLTHLSAGSSAGESVRYEQFASPPAIGTTTPAAGKFTTLESTGALTTAGQITSTLATGTAPFVVNSTTEVANLTTARATNISNGGANRIPYNTGSGATSFVVAPTIDSTVLSWSSAGGFSWADLVSGSTTTAISSSEITLTNSSNQYQIAQINNATNNIVNLPNATTISKGYARYVIANNSPIGANLSIKNNTGTIVGYINAGYVAVLSLTDNATADGVWVSELVHPQTYTQFNAASLASNALVGSAYVGIIGISPSLFIRVSATTTGTNTATVTITTYLQACSISGSTITYGATTSFVDSANVVGGLMSGSIFYQIIRLSDTAFVVKRGFYWSNNAAAYAGNMNIRTCTVSGTTITIGTSSAAGFPSTSGGANSQAATAVAQNGSIARLSDTSFAIVYNDAVTIAQAPPYNYSGSLACQIITVSGTTQTVGTKVQLGTSTYTQPVSMVALSATSLFVAYGQGTAGSAIGRTKMNVISVSGTVPTFGTSVTIESADVGTAVAYGVADAAVAPSATQVVFNTAYGVAEGTVSGTVPTYDSMPSSSTIYPLFLATATKAYAPNLNNGTTYLNIATGGFIKTTGAVNILAQASSIGYPIVGSPLGAQPTTSFIGLDYSNSDVNILGNTL